MTDRGTDESSVGQAGRDRKLLEALERLLLSHRRGETVDGKLLRELDPDGTSDLEQLWHTALLAEDLVGPEPEVVDPRQGGVSPPDFEIDAEIGRGGMGVVYRARQLSLNRTVALKMIISPGASQEERERFCQEAEAVGRLDHPHIVPIYHVGEEGNQPYFAMRYLDGGNLADRLREGPLEPRKAAALLVPICRALQTAHDRGVVHRDVKPSNILLDADGTPYLSDFGLAKRLEPDADSLTATGAILGTPSYASPEQTGVGGGVGALSDVYGLGALLYHMVTGRPPFQAASPWEVVTAVREEDPLPPRLLQPGIDRDLEIVILKCLQKAAPSRYGSAEDLASDLEAFLRGDPVSARVTSFSGMVRRLLRESHHVLVLEHWGLLWMWHSVVLLVLCVTTNLMWLQGWASRLSLVAFWGVGFSVWGLVLVRMRRKSGPITFVERQVIHVWGFSIISSVLLFVVEKCLGLEPLSLSPVIGLIGGSVFFVKAGILSGKFYFQAAALYGMALVMAFQPRWAISLFGVVAGICFFVPGFKIYRRGKRSV